VTPAWDGAPRRVRQGEVRGAPFFRLVEPGGRRCDYTQLGDALKVQRSFHKRSTEPSDCGLRLLTWLIYKSKPARLAGLTVEAQAADPDSMLSLYRSALGLRRTDPDLRTERFRWLRSDPAVLAFGRGDRFVAIANLGSTPVAAPSGGELLLSSHELVDGCLPGDATGWWRLGRPPGDER